MRIFFSNGKSGGVSFGGLLLAQTRVCYMRIFSLKGELGGYMAVCERFRGRAAISADRRTALSVAAPPGSEAPALRGGSGAYYGPLLSVGSAAPCPCRRPLNTSGSRIWCPCYRCDRGAALRPRFVGAAPGERHIDAPCRPCRTGQAYGPLATRTRCIRPCCYLSILCAGRSLIGRSCIAYCTRCYLVAQQQGLDRKLVT